MAEKTMFVKISNAQWIAEIHQQGPIVTPIELPSKIVSTLVRKNYKVTAVNKQTKEEVKLTVLNVMDPFKAEAPKKEAPKAKPINPNIGEAVQETVQPKKEEPVMEEAPVEEVTEEAVVTGLATVEEAEDVEEEVEAVTVVAEDAPVENKPQFNYNGKKNKNKNFTK